MKLFILSFLFCAQAFAGYAPWGDQHWRSPVSSEAALPAIGNLIGDVRVETTDFGEYVWNGSSWQEISGNSGTVTSVSVASANGFSGTVANATTTPAITVRTSITGLLLGNGTSVSAAVSGTDYSAGTSSNATGIVKSTTGTGALTTAVAADFPTLNQNTTGTAANLAGIYAIPSPGPSGDIMVATGSSWLAQVAPSPLPSPGPSGDVLTATGTSWIASTPAASGITALTGDVTASGSGSVAATLAATTNATLTTLSALASIDSGVAANTFIASPNGSSGAMTPRAIVSADIPTLNQNTTGTAANLAGIYAIPSPGPSGDVLTATGSSWIAGAINLASAVTGVLPIANGGTDNGSLGVTAGGVLYTDGTKVQNVGAGTSGYYLKSNGSSPPSWTASSFTPTTLTVHIFTSGTSQTYTTPTNPSPLWLKVTVVGGGGGGGGGGTVSASAGSGGGGGGATSIGYITSSIASTYTYTVAASASGGTSGNPGAVGNSSSFGSFTANGGGAGGTVGTTTTSGAGGAGGTASGGTINITGQGGSSGSEGISGVASGMSGTGGSSTSGGGGAGINSNTTANGNQGGNYGGGGSGATQGGTGGEGAIGIISVEEHYQ